jgi:hypothetical protein
MDKMIGACGAHERDVYTKIQLKKIKEREYLVKLGISGKKLLKLGLKMLGGSLRI